MEITSKRLNLLYRLVVSWSAENGMTGQGSKYKLSEPTEPLEIIEFANLANVEQHFTDWAHNDIATELQGIIDDDDIIMEIRIWNRND